MPPAARISDMHVCPKVEPGPVPHVGGPTSSGESTVIIGGMPAARVGDSLVCFGGPPDSISQGEATVIIGGKLAARLGDGTSHGGVLVAGCPTVIIGSSAQAQTVVVAARDGTPFCEECEKKRLAQEEARRKEEASLAESPGVSSSSGPSVSPSAAKEALASHVVDDVTHWPPRPPQGKPPALDAANAAEWRYNRYRYIQVIKNKKTQKELLDFETYKERHFKAAATGGRPGRGGGSDQVSTRNALVAEGFKNVENISLNGKYVDLVKAENASGGTDYVEVDALLQKGIPIKRLREKLKVELAALQEGDTLIYVDKADPSKRIIYEYGDDPGTIDLKTWKKHQGDEARK